MTVPSLPITVSTTPSFTSVWKEEYTCILFRHPSTVSTVCPIFCTLSTLPCPPFFLVLFWLEVSFQNITFSETKKFQVEEGYLTPWHSDSVEGKAEYLSRLDKLWVISNHNRSVQGYRYRDTGSNHNRSVQGYHISSPVSLLEDLQADRSSHLRLPMRVWGVPPNLFLTVICITLELMT